MTIEEMKNRKKELGWSNEELAAKSGVPLGTVQKVFGGATASPRRKTVEALEAVLKPKQRIVYPELYPAEYPDGSSFAERRPAYGSGTPPHRFQGEYTIEDYYALPDDNRYELIDGVLYDMAAPSYVHQILLAFLVRKLGGFVEANKGKCIVVPAPLDVQLDMDDRTMVQPDVVVMCSRDRVRMKGAYGAPDLVIEILSPSTAAKDTLIKLPKYRNAGVRECWIVDPVKKQVWAYFFENGFTPVRYSFAEKVPVMIWDGKCEVDFAEIYEDMKFLYGED